MNALFILLFILVEIASQPTAETVVVRSVTPCRNNSGDCKIHVFRVRLSDAHTEEGVKAVIMKPRKKYGNNVFAPAGNQESEKMTEEIMENLPQDIDTRVKDRILKGDYMIAPVGEDVNDTVDETLEEEPTVEAAAAAHPKDVRRRVPVTPVDDFPVFLTLLLVAIGVVVGILCTCLVLFTIDYKRKPKFDRSSVISYKRPSLTEKIVYDPKMQVIERSIEMHNMYSPPRSGPSSSRGIPIRGPPRMNRLTRESEMLRAASRESDRRMHMERKISF